LCTAQFSGGAIYLGFAGTGTIRQVMIADLLPLAAVLHIWLEQPPFRRQLLDHREQVTDRAGEPVEPDHDESAAGGGFAGVGRHWRHIRRGSRAFVQTQELSANGRLIRWPDCM
jgi:hypothetical protein